MTNEIRLLVELNASHYSSLREGRRSLEFVLGKGIISCKRSGVRVGRKRKLGRKERALRMSERVSKIVAEKKWRVGS